MIHTRKASKVIYAGGEGSGKSLRLAKVANLVLHDNAYWYTVTGVPRPIYTNILFSEEFKERARVAGIPVITWKSLTELVGLTGCDIFIDEIGVYFDSRLWQDIPFPVRYWVAQCDKNGVNIYGTAQDFAQVDKSFRRLVKELYMVRKVLGSGRPHATYPVIKHPWGVFFYRSVNPKAYKEDTAVVEEMGVPSFFFLHKEDYSIYSTNQKIDFDKQRDLEHVESVCKRCGIVKVKHY